MSKWESSLVFGEQLDVLTSLVLGLMLFTVCGDQTPNWFPSSPQGILLAL